MNRFYKKAAEGGQDVDLTPMIDVVFILLIFFMVSTTFVKDQAMDIERPGAQSGKVAGTKALRIQIDSQGTVYLENNPVRSWMVRGRVREALASGDVSSVLVVSDRRVPAELLIEVVDQARLGGATEVGVATEAEAGGL